MIETLPSIPGVHYQIAGDVVIKHLRKLVRDKRMEGPWAKPFIMIGTRQLDALAAWLGEIGYPGDARAATLEKFGKIEGVPFTKFRMNGIIVI